VKAVDLGRFDGAPGNSPQKPPQKGRNIMSEETKKIEKKSEQTEPEAKASELSEQELEKAAGGAGSAGYLKSTSRVTD
jgi:hypothetical protein